MNRKFRFESKKKAVAFIKRSKKELRKDLQAARARVEDIKIELRSYHLKPKKDTDGVTDYYVKFTVY